MATLTVAPSLGASVDVDIVFSAAEKRIIYEFFGGGSAVAVSKQKGKGKPGRSGGLPPGLQKHLERRGTLPPGLAKRDLPPGLSSQLPPTTLGQKRYIVGSDIVLIEAATGLILDILEGVLD
jgi:hypothetical protein